MANETRITGYYGCSCHPFESWEECKKYHNQKLAVDTEVKNRCTGKTGKIIEVYTGSDKGFVVVKYGKYRSDEHLEHVASLIPTSEINQSQNFNIGLHDYSTRF